MLTDEQILQKATLLLEQISENSDLTTEALLREISDSEMKGVEAILQKLADNPEGVLAFDELFGDKARLIIPFPVKDKTSYLGQWVYELEQNLKVKPDYEKGMISIDREWKDHEKPNEPGVRGGPQIKKKLQMKIGRYFTKLDELIKQYKQMRQKIAAGLGYPSDEFDPNLDPSRSEIELALDEQELKKYNKLLNSLELHMGTSSHGGVINYALNSSQQEEWADNEQKRREEQDKGDIAHGKKPRTRKPIVAPETGFKIMGDYWVKKANWIKENINTLENDRYSIILTRHPVDVMRMSDFDKITSCHTPPSRAEQQQAYYKCAVAEAQGHGAIAYVVETDDLFSQTNTSNIESAQQELEEYDEIFTEQNRYLHGTNLDLTPVSRTRLRQFRYFRDFDGEDEPYEGKELAVPEKAIYGIEIPGLINTVTKWAKEKQEDLFEKLPRKDGKINLDNFEIYGGSYEDTQDAVGREILMMNLTGLQSNEFVGDVKQNIETEDDLPPEWVGDIEKMLNKSCEAVAREWNPKYASCEVDFYVRTHDHNEWFVIPEGKLMLRWSLDEWKQLPNVVVGQDIADYLNQSYYDPEIPSGDLFDIETGAIYRGGPENNEGIIFRCEFNNQLVPSMNGETTVFDADGFKYFCKGIDQLDDRRDRFQAIVEEFAKQEGYLEGGAYVNLAMKIENREIDSYYWDVEYDGEHHTDSYEAWATIKYDFDPEALGVEPRILFDLVDRREFALRLRGFLTSTAREETGSEYWLTVRDKSAVEVGGDIRYSIAFKVDSDTPDELVEQFEELVTGDMDDEDEISKAFMSALREEAQKNGVKLNGDSLAPEKVRDFDALQDLGESKRYDADYLVNTWKRFIL